MGYLRVHVDHELPQIDEEHVGQVDDQEARGLDYDDYFNFIPNDIRHQAAQQIGGMMNLVSWDQANPDPKQYVWDLGQ